MLAKSGCRVAIQDLVPATSRLYVIDQIGGPSEVRLFGLDGNALGAVPLPPVSVRGLVRTKGDEILRQLRNLSEPAAVDPVWRFRETEPNRAERGGRCRFQRLRYDPRVCHVERLNQSAR
jgi:hypothetical protein